MRSGSSFLQPSFRPCRYFVRRFVHLHVSVQIASDTLSNASFAASSSRRLSLLDLPQLILWETLIEISFAYFFLYHFISIMILIILFIGIFRFIVTTCNYTLIC